MVRSELRFESGSRRWERAGGRSLLVQVDRLGVERAMGLARAMERSRTRPRCWLVAERSPRGTYGLGAEFPAP